MRVIYKRKKARSNIIPVFKYSWIFLLKINFRSTRDTSKVYIIRSVSSVVYHILILHKSNVIGNHCVKNSLKEVLRIMMVPVIIQDLETEQLRIAIPIPKQKPPLIDVRYQSSPENCIIHRKIVLESFFNEIVVLHASRNFFETETAPHVFPVNFRKKIQNSFFSRTTSGY